MSKLQRLLLISEKDSEAYPIFKTETASSVYHILHQTEMCTILRPLFTHEYGG